MIKANRVAFFVLVSLFFSFAEATEEKSSKINLFKDVVEAVGAAGDAIISLTDSIEHLVVTGSDAYDYVSAAREHNRLKDLSARGTNLVHMKQSIIVETIDEYLEKSNPDIHDWNNIKADVLVIIDDVGLLLADIEQERSDFVLEEAYAKLGKTLHQRAIILDKIRALPKPSSPEELEQLNQINLKYKRLIQAFKEAIVQLNIYIRQLENR
tara:strand:+ start:32 stop:664 length:633 start_codon:yes stop_codon:yes gene_type:complete